MSEERKENIQTGNPLGEVSVASLMVKFAVPSIIAMLVSALYNIVDQLFIGQAVGTLGNAATNVAFPLTTSCIALALMFGIGGASCFNLNMGGGHKDRAVYFVGNAIICLIGSGVILKPNAVRSTGRVLNLQLKSFEYDYRDYRTFHALH